MTQGQIYIIEIFLWGAAVMMVRSRELAKWQVVVLSLAGFYLAMTPLGVIVQDLFSGIVESYRH